MQRPLTQFLYLSCTYTPAHAAYIYAAYDTGGLTDTPVTVWSQAAVAHCLLHLRLQHKQLLQLRLLHTQPLPLSRPCLVLLSLLQACCMLLLLLLVTDGCCAAGSHWCHKRLRRNRQLLLLLLALLL